MLAAKHRLVFFKLNNSLISRINLGLWQIMKSKVMQKNMIAVLSSVVWRLFWPGRGGSLHLKYIWKSKFYCICIGNHKSQLSSQNFKSLKKYLDWWMFALWCRKDQSIILCKILQVFKEYLQYVYIN